jgi:hypothetical protein
MARAAQRAPQRPVDEYPDFEIFEDKGDAFYVPPDLIPDGMTYQWCRWSYMGKEDRPNIARLERNRWTPVPANRPGHEILGGESTDPDPNGRKHPFEGCIIKEGLLLMERPEQITAKVVARDKRVAAEQVQNQLAHLKLVPDGTLSDKHGRRASLQRDRDLSIPEDQGYTADAE